MAIDLKPLRDLLKTAQTVRVRGRVTELTGLVIKAAVPNVRIGEVCLIRARPRRGARRGGRLPGRHGDAHAAGRALGHRPRQRGDPHRAAAHHSGGDGLLGRVLNGLGEPIDGRPLPTEAMVDWAVDRDCPDPFKRQRITRPLPLGVRCIDGLLTVGEGQRIGLFAGSGVGKSTLMGQIARQHRRRAVGHRAHRRAWSRGAGVHRGRAGRGGHEALGGGLRHLRPARRWCACAPASWPPPSPSTSASAGGNVLFMLDTVTRLARAQREIGLAIGEPPARQGYPPSVFSMLPRMLERTGNSEKGKCTAIYTVLVAGGDMEEPIADEVRGILDGHFILNRAIGERNQWPAMDVLGLAVPRDEPDRHQGAQEGRRQAARDALHLREAARPHPARRLPVRHRPTHRLRHRQVRARSSNS